MTPGLLDKRCIVVFFLISVIKDNQFKSFTLLPETEIAEFANSVDLDEVAHNEPPHQDLHCLPSNL